MGYDVSAGAPIPSMNWSTVTIWKALSERMNAHNKRYLPIGLRIGTIPLYSADNIKASESPSNSSAGSSVSLPGVELLFIISSTATSSI